MYQYDDDNRRIVRERVAQFRDQVRRRLDGALSEEEFRPLRLQNGLYLQRHAYMLRVAIPYGILSTTQLRQLALIARRWDRDYGHFTTRQNIQYNWPKLEDVPDILDALADVEMHAIQTSGNCIRNTTSDPFAGVARDEVADPRPVCELIRQWSTFHPEFAYLPRKFKIAVTGAENDRAAIAAHDIGIRLVRNDEGRVGAAVYAGGGLGRTPVLATLVNGFVELTDLLSYIEAILRVYNLSGDRKNKYKARIKILVKTMGADAFRAAVEEEFTAIRQGALQLDTTELDRMATFFAPPTWTTGLPPLDPASLPDDERPRFERWLQRNTHDHRAEGYRIVSISLKSPERPPGDATSAQMDLLADLADEFSLGEVRVTHEQNLVLPHVEEHRLPDLWRALDQHALATPNIGTLTDMICCPGLDFCALANAGSISVARSITDRFDNLDYLYDLGELQLKISGCINACGHHHVGHIGILGINKNDEEWYQIMLGGSATDDASLGRIIGPAVPREKVPDVLEAILHTYVQQREGEERFLDTYRRLGAKPFKEAAYADHP
ncbi:MAG: nitrite/sulfite reductase [Deltaproteobacteria bacterium]|nr:MAG: nitrite/sulfite reductase [Deltaproteobacteria bacterium]